MDDAKLLRQITSDLRVADAEYPERLARQLMVHFLRQHDSDHRSWAPGDAIPDEVDRVRDVDRDMWRRQSLDGPTPADLWKMDRADPCDPPARWTLTTAALLARSSHRDPQAGRRARASVTAHADSQPEAKLTPEGRPNGLLPAPQRWGH